MRDQDRPAFAELLLGVGETYGEPVSEARMEIYFRALADLELEAIRAAVNIHVRTQKFFPRPSEILEAVGGSVDDRAELAWIHVQDQVRHVGYNGTPTWPDDATRRAAMELYGGWQALCANLPAYGPELLGYAKQFKATFRSYAARDVRDQLGPGESERLETRESAAKRLTGVLDALRARGYPTPGFSAPGDNAQRASRRGTRALSASHETKDHSVRSEESGCE